MSEPRLHEAPVRQRRDPELPARDGPAERLELRVHDLPEVTPRTNTPVIVLGVLLFAVLSALAYWS